MLKTRILTAAVGIPFIFLCIYFGGLVFFALMFLVNLLCLKEYFSLCEKYNPRRTLSLIMGSLFFIPLSFINGFDNADSLFDLSGLIEVPSISLSTVLIISALIIFLILFALEVFSQKPQNAVSRIAVSFLGIFFFPVSLSFMVYIRALYLGAHYIFLLFVTVWVLDTAAYAAGSKLGKRKLSPEISPKKTVEGAIAGIIFGALTSFIIGTAVFEILSPWQSLVLGLVIAITGQFSDLAESLIKRDAGIKDSGNTIPGHGGVLDRFDSYFFAAPAAYFLILLLQGTNY